MAKRVVVLTGGIGCGKSLAAGLFERLGVPVVDADQIAHRLTGASGAAMAEIAQAFGPGVIAPDGSLDRAVMRQQIFHRSADRLRLEAILHPRIQALAQQELDDAEGPYALYVVPLWAETHRRTATGKPTDEAFADTGLVNGRQGITAHAVVVVDCPRDIQIDRVMRRSHLTRDEVCAMIAAQATRQERLAIADAVLTNSGSTEELADQVRALHTRLIQP